ncbi:hypothetical protein DB30_02464 [Enhygromyxa salina]|uniref:Uncharacterized protein n=1 Tax=Enhygromyxa salina TaxID=215803 RepID=A0A0C2DDX0_9BACT|nr:hypothetical protein [Enhygromyxa salina]KIG17842.1 hypothetical protein DB30_02464 [Enhygromyxa salina]
MRRLGFVIGLCLLAPAILLPATTSAAKTTSAPHPAAKGEIHAAYVKVALTRDGNTFAHPGFLMASDEQGVFVIQCEGKDHEITLSFRELGESRAAVLVEYGVNGRVQWAEEIDVKAGDDAKLVKGKSTLTINVDPHGQEDTSRGDDDQLDGPKNDEDDPLGGM